MFCWELRSMVESGVRGLHVVVLIGSIRSTIGSLSAFISDRICDRIMSKVFAIAYLCVGTRT